MLKKMKQQINTAVASYGMSGEIFHVPFLLFNPGFKITKVLERTKENSKAKLPDAQIVRSYQDILNDGDVNLVVVNTPNYLHYEMAKQALLAGKHVLVEKPFTIKVDEAKELIELAKKQNLVLTVYQNRRLDGDFKTVQKILKENVLGNIKLFDSQILRWKPELGGKQWKIGANEGGGLLYDLGSHLIDQALTLFGLPTSVFADLGILRQGAVVDDYFELLLFYDNFKVTLKSSLLANDQGHRFMIQGDKAAFTKYGNDPQEEQLSSGEALSSKNWGKEDKSTWGLIHSATESYSYKSLDGSYMDFFENLHAAITKGGELLVKPEEAMQVIKIIELANQSFKEKRVIDL